MRVNRTRTVVGLSLLLTFAVLFTVGWSVDAVYVYDSLNRLIEIRYADKVIRYTYDDAGNRIGVTTELLAALPGIQNLVPGGAVVGWSGLQLSIFGSNFAPNSVVQWNGVDRSTTYIGPNELRIAVAAADFASVGTASVVVVNGTAPNLAISNSAQFSIIPACAVTPNPTDANVLAPGGTGNITITSGCAWTATSPDTWITITGGGSGNGNGTISYSVSPNTGPQRTGSISIGGQTFPITQAAGNLSITGTVAYGTTPTGQPAKLVPGVQLTAAGPPPATATSNSSGAYSLTSMGAGPYAVTPTKSGDVNGISALDAARVAQHAAGIITLEPNQQVAGDSTNNGSLSALDAARIAQTAAGITNPGIAGQWKFLPGSRNYPTFSSDLTGEDYTAILVGDVTGNWSPPQGRPEPESEDFDPPRLSATSERTEGPVKTVKAIAGGIPVTLPTNSAAAAGTTVTVPVTIGDTTGQGIVAYDFVLTFDPSVLTPAASPTSTAATLSSGWTITPNNSTPGRLTVAAFNTADLAGGGTLLNLHFNVVGAAASTSALTWMSFALNEDEVASNAANGQFTVQSPTAANVTLGGRVTTHQGFGIAKAWLTLVSPSGERRTTITNSFGYYEFDGISPGETHVISVGSKRYKFNPPTIVVPVFDQLLNVNFVADP